VTTENGSLRALDGVRVLDLSRQTPGGAATALLADFGADVLKVEDTGAGDYLRWAPPRLPGDRAPSAAGAAFAALNRGKRSARIDLKHPDGRAAFLALVPGADVVVDSFRPGVLARLGIDHDALVAVNPRIVTASITAYGADGPDAGRSAHDLNLIGRAGILALTGHDADADPVVPATMVADYGVAAQATVAILIALLERERSGLGQHVDASMLDATVWQTALAAAVTWNGGQRLRRGAVPLAGAIACYRPYRCADGWVTIAAVEAKFWTSFCHAVGRPELVGEQFALAGSPAQEAVASVFAARTRDAWAAFATEHDCCVDVVLEPEEVAEDPQVLARGLVAEVGGARQVGAPVHLSRTPARVGSEAPVLGQHTAEALRAAGLTGDDVERLAGLGAIGLLQPEATGTFL